MSCKYLQALAVMSAVLLSSVTALQSQSQTAPQPAVQRGSHHASPQRHSQQQHAEEGQRIFDENCSRCHNAPEGFSPNISGTIVRHMRVRANLSQHDAEELLRFFNP